MYERTMWALLLLAAAGVLGCSDDGIVSSGVMGSSGVGGVAATGATPPVGGTTTPVAGATAAPVAGATAPIAGATAPIAGASAPVAGAAAAGAGAAGTGMAGAAAVAGAGGASGSAAAGTNAAAAGMGGSAAGAAGSGGPSGAPTFTAIFKEILTVGSAGNCMFAGCHGGPPDPMVNGNLTIMFDDQAGAYKNLLNVTSTSTLCMGRKLVIPGDAANSLLLQKFSDTPPCGEKMPIGRPLTSAQIQQIVQWIMQGAMDN